MQDTGKTLEPHFILRFRFWGIRALNWSQKSFQNKMPQLRHADETGCAPWMIPRRVNIIIGPNGGGKTTTLDLIRALRCPDVWPSLPRENAPGDTFSGFVFEGEEWALKAEFRASPSKDVKQGIRERLLCVVPGLEHEPHHRSEKATMPLRDDPKSLPDRWRTTIERVIKAAKVPEIWYCEPAGKRPEQDTPDLFGILNDYWPSLHGVSPVDIPGVDVDVPPFGRDMDADGDVALVLTDDRAQPSKLRVEYLPFGWRQFAYVISFMRRSARNSIIILDEPDRALHPRLQRLLIEEISKIAKDRQQQVFLSTNSHSLANPSLIEEIGAAVFRAAGTRLTVLDDHRDVLDDLGLNSSDLAQANGVIWVEGPSDRIYINRWLQLYAEHAGLDPWIEGINYQIAFYGGALLKYLTLEDHGSLGGNLVSIRALNRKFYVLIDRDNDSFEASNEGKENSKHRLRNEAEAFASGHRSVPPIWITQHYTIEDYLPAIFGRWIKKVDDRTRIVGKKVILADRFRLAEMSWRECFRDGSDLPIRIEQLFREIAFWQQTSKEPRLDAITESSED